MSNPFSKDSGSGSVGASGGAPTRFITTSPGYSLSSDIVGDRARTTLTRSGTVPQNEFGIRFPRILSDVDTLRGTIKPGFSDIRNARLDAVRAGRERAMSDITETVAQRRLGGSSLENNLRLQAENTFSGLEAQQMAQSFVEELQANTAILTQEFGALTTALNQELAELGVAAGTNISIAQLSTQGAQFAAALAAQEAAASGQMLGGLLGLGVGSLGAGGPFGSFGAFRNFSPNVSGWFGKDTGGSVTPSTGSYSLYDPSGGGYGNAAPF